MNDSSPQSTALGDNPFQSPMEIEPRPESDPNSPSPQTLWTCLAVGSLINLAASIPFYTDANKSIALRASWVVPDLLIGVTYSLGLALLVHAVRYRQWSTLMPGHWRLIAFLSTCLAYAAPPAASLSAMVAFILFAVVTQEQWVWKTFAWLAVISYFLESGQLAILTLMFGDLTPDSAAVAPNSEFGNFSNPWFIAFMGISVVSSLISLAVLVTLFLGIIMDLQQKVRRDLYHYLGLILVFVLPIVQAIWAMMATSDVLSSDFSWGSL